MPQATFFVHQLSVDHAEGITTIDMNGDGRPDILSGAYWYENPGPQGGEWKRHQYRTVEIVGEFVSDCGEWAVDVNHDGAPDVVTVGWMTDGLWWYENPKKPGVDVAAPPDRSHHRDRGWLDGRHQRRRQAGSGAGPLRPLGHHSGSISPDPSRRSIMSAGTSKMATASAWRTSMATARWTF